MAPPSKAAAFLAGHLWQFGRVANVTVTTNKRYQPMGVVMSKGVPTKNTFTSEKTSWTRASFLKSSSTDDWIRSFLSSRFHCLDHSGTQLSRRVGDPNLRKFGARYARCIGSLGPTRVFFFRYIPGLPNASLFQCCDLILVSNTVSKNEVAPCCWLQKRFSHLNMEKKTSLQYLFPPSKLIFQTNIPNNLFFSWISKF